MYGQSAKHDCDYPRPARGGALRPGATYARGAAHRAEDAEAGRNDHPRVSEPASFAEEQVSKPQGSRRAPWALASLKEAWDATVHRVRRNIFTMLGVVLGIASLVLTVGLTATISGQLADSFDIFRAKHLTISSTRTEAMSRAELLSLAASENYRRVSQLNG